MKAGIPLSINEFSLFILAGELGINHWRNSRRRGCRRIQYTGQPPLWETLAKLIASITWGFNHHQVLCRFGINLRFPGLFHWWVLALNTNRFPVNSQAEHPYRVCCHPGQLPNSGLWLLPVLLAKDVTDLNCTKGGSDYTEQRSPLRTGAKRWSNSSRQHWSRQFEQSHFFVPYSLIMLHLLLFLVQVLIHFIDLRIILGLWNQLGIELCLLSSLSSYYCFLHLPLVLVLSIGLHGEDGCQAIDKRFCQGDSIMATFKAVSLESEAALQRLLSEILLF